MITIVTIEGVLSRGDDLRNAQPTKIAKALYDGLRLTTNTIGLTRANNEIARWWLKREHFNDWASVLSYPDNALTWDHWRVDQVRGLLADGWEIFAYVDTNIYVVDEVRALGVTAICVTYPVTAPGWKEVSAPRAWSNIVTTLGDTIPGKD